MPPESCIFGQLLNIGAFLLSVIFYIKYKQVADFYRSHTDKKMLKRINNVSLIIGLIGALGVRQVRSRSYVLDCLDYSLVANFQETSVRSVHMIGAFSSFGGGTIYLWLQVMKMRRHHDSSFYCLRSTSPDS